MLPEDPIVVETNIPDVPEGTEGLVENLREEI